MYRQRHFVSEDTTHLYDLIEQARVGFLIGADGGEVTASLIPVIVDRDEARLLGHLARANPLCDVLRATELATWLFTATDAYVSPSMYPSKAHNSKVVPTWNYQSVEVSGVATIYEDPTVIIDLVDRLTTHHERGRVEPWSIDDAPEEFIDKMATAIVGVTLTITSLIGTDKLSQNRPVEDRRGVQAALLGGTASDRAVGEALRRLDPQL